MLGLAERGGHAAFAANAFFKSHRSEIAVQAVTPIVVDAHELVDLAPLVQDQRRSLMGAPVDHRADITVLVAHDNDGGVADMRQHK